MKHSQYYVRWVHALLPKNKFQKAVYSESFHWQKYLVDSVPEFQKFVADCVERMHQKHLRCGAMEVYIVPEQNGEVFRIDVGDIVFLYLHLIKGRWTKQGGFQRCIEEGGEQL